MCSFNKQNKELIQSQEYIHWYVLSILKQRQNYINFRDRIIIFYNINP